MRARISLSRCTEKPKKSSPKLFVLLESLNFLLVRSIYTLSSKVKRGRPRRASLAQLSYTQVVIALSHVD